MNISAYVRKREAKLDRHDDPRPIAENSKHGGWISIFGVALPFLTALFFAAGKAYRQSYLEPFGFNDVVFPWSFQDLVTLGTAIQLPWILLGLSLAIIAVLVGFILELAPKWARKVKHGSTKVPRQFLENLFTCLAIVLTFIVISVVFIVVGIKEGGYDARKELVAIEHAKTGKITADLPKYARIKRRVNDEVVQEEGYLITCSDKACGLYAPQEKNETARVVPLDNIVSFSLRAPLPGAAPII